MQNLLRIGYENILLKTSVNLWGDYQYLSRTASIGLGPAVPLTGSQNLVQTIHHEYLHYIGVESHVTNPAGWGIRMRDDIGGWINDI